MAEYTDQAQHDSISPKIDTSIDAQVLDRLRHALGAEAARRLGEVLRGQDPLHAVQLLANAARLVLAYEEGESLPPLSEQPVELTESIQIEIIVDDHEVSGSADESAPLSKQAIGYIGKLFDDIDDELLTVENGPAIVDAIIELRESVAKKAHSTIYQERLRKYICEGLRPIDISKQEGDQQPDGLAVSQGFLGIKVLLSKIDQETKRAVLFRMLEAKNKAELTPEPETPEAQLQEEKEPAEQEEDPADTLYGKVFERFNDRYPTEDIQSLAKLLTYSPDSTNRPFDDDLEDAREIVCDLMLVYAPDQYAAVERGLCDEAAYECLDSLSGYSVDPQRIEFVARTHESKLNGRDVRQVVLEFLDKLLDQATELGEDEPQSVNQVSVLPEEPEISVEVAQNPLPEIDLYDVATGGNEVDKEVWLHAAEKMFKQTVASGVLKEEEAALLWKRSHFDDEDVYKEKADRAVTDVLNIIQTLKTQHTSQRLASNREMSSALNMFSVTLFGVNTLDNILSKLQQNGNDVNKEYVERLVVAAIAEVVTGAQRR